MSIFNQDKSENGNENYEFGIKFKKELTNGSLVFLIVDEDYDHAGGYVVVSPSGIPTVIKDDFYEIDDENCKYISSLARDFFQATKK